MNPMMVGPILDIGKTLIDRFIPNPQQKLEAQAKLLEMQQRGELKELETRMGAILAEAKSTDPWTSRARPSFMYVFYFVILALVVIAPAVGVLAPDHMAQFFDNVGKGFKAIPDALWATFTAGYLGYAGARTFEKTKGAAK